MDLDPAYRRQAPTCLPAARLVVTKAAAASKALTGLARRNEKKHIERVEKTKKEKKEKKENKKTKGRTKAATAARMRVMMLPMIMLAMAVAMRGGRRGRRGRGGSWRGRGGGRGGERGRGGAADGGRIYASVRSSRMSCGNHLHWKYFRHFVVAATVKICFSTEVRIGLGSSIHLFSVFQPATMRSAVSTAICRSGLAGILAVSAKLRIWPVVISLSLRLPPKFRASMSPGIVGERCHKIVGRRRSGMPRIGVPPRV